jgi:hypothetical protein
LENSFSPPFLCLQSWKLIYAVRRTTDALVISLRSDYILYLIGIALLIVAGFVLVSVESLQAPLGGRLIYSALVFVMALFGATSLIFGYNLRPKVPLHHQAPSIGSDSMVEYSGDLTRVKGIGTRRAAQLKALGINSVADLAASSAEDIAEKLNVSPKRTSRWITEARKQFLQPDQDRAETG